MCEGIIVEATTGLLDSFLKYNTKPMVVAILLLQRKYELADGMKETYFCYFLLENLKMSCW